MMKTYLLRIRPEGTFVTPWQADTIFGNLCWIKASQDGSKGVEEFLKPYNEGNPPFILSDGMPGDLLPAPVYLPLVITTEDYQSAKRIKKAVWLRSEDFQRIVKGQHAVDISKDIKPFKPFTTLHNTINRLTGTTGDEGSLFELEEYAFDSKQTGIDYISIYIKIRDGYEDTVMSLFKELSKSGYGAKKSVGKGSFEVLGELEEFAHFQNYPMTNAFVTLSNYLPAPNDPTRGLYKTVVKYGKLGGQYTFSTNPFKRPLMMLATGSVFWVDNVPKPYYGCMVTNIAPSRPEVVHYGYAFTVPTALYLGKA